MAPSVWLIRLVDLQLMPIRWYVLLQGSASALETAAADMGQAAGALVAAERHVADLADKKVGVNLCRKHSLCAQVRLGMRQMSACNRPAAIASARVCKTLICIYVSSMHKCQAHHLCLSLNLNLLTALNAIPWNAERRTSCGWCLFASICQATTATAEDLFDLCHAFGGMSKLVRVMIT